MKAYAVHYKNKYPGGRVEQSEDKLDVYCAGGEHRVALRKNGAGQWVDVSEEMGCQDKHDLAPIPKECRAWKLHKDGKIAPSEEFAEREAKRKEVAAHFGGRVPSEKEIADEVEKAKKAKLVQPA